MRIQSLTSAEPATTRKKKCNELGMASAGQGKKTMGSLSLSMVPDEVSAQVTLLIVYYHNTQIEAGNFVL